MKIRSSRMREHLITVLSLVAATTAESFADWMTKDFCDRKLTVGEIIMNNLVEASDDRFIRVFRGEEMLTSGSIYHHSESLTVSISDSHNQFVYEAIGGAVFDKGGCDGKRVANKPQATLKMPKSGDETISIVAGWASSHEAVSLSPTFILIAESWSDRRGDLAPKAKVAETREDSPPKVADVPQVAPTEEEGGQLDPEDHRRVQDEKIPEPQENLYAHELHKDEHDHHHDRDDHEGVDHEHSHHEHDEEHHNDHHEMAIRDDPQDHLSHSNLIPRLADKEEHTGDNLDTDRERDHRVHDMRHRDPEDLHGNRFDLFRRGREKLNDVMGRGRPRPRDDDVKHGHKDAVHPHSEDIRDHDVFDMVRKKAMDKIRDRDLFQGRPDEGTAHEEKDPKAYNEHGELHRKAAKSLKSLMKNRPKRALRGATYTEYVRTHTVLVGECALGGIALAYIGYRIFARYRYKVHRYINKVKGVEEK